MQFIAQTLPETQHIFRHLPSRHTLSTSCLQKLLCLQISEKAKHAACTLQQLVNPGPSFGQHLLHILCFVLKIWLLHDGVPVYLQ